MEFRDQDVAQLVLGYLKESKCKKAFGEFLNTSVHLRDHAANYRKGQYFVTRVAGLSLVEYLIEYAHIYTIVQERLEASEYYKENQSRTSLVKQLLYLLNKLEIQSRTSTPINQEIVTDRSLFPDINHTNNLDSENENVPDNESFNRITSRVSSTPASQTLNSTITDSSLLNRSKNKTLTPKADKSTSTEDNPDGKDNSHEKCEEIFTHTFLDNVELIEKLADNINKQVTSKLSADLDSSAIESIVQRTETDPIFVQLLNELIDTPIENKNLEDTFDLQKPSTSDKSKEPSITKKTVTPNNDGNETNIKRRLRSSKQFGSKKNTTIDEQNNAAIESICMHAAATLAEEQLPQSASTKNATLISTELVLSTEQNLNFTQSLYTTPTTPNTMFTNTGSLLMLQPSTSIATPNILPQKPLTLDASQSCYLIGNQPFVNVSVPQTPLKLPGVITEQDILSMPTIFVCDAGQQLSSAQTMVVPSNATNVVGQPRFHNIAPRQTPDKRQSLSEYITLYKCSDAISSPAVQSKQTSLNVCAPVEQETTRMSKNNENNLENITHLSAIQAESALVPSTSPVVDKSETPLLIVSDKKDKGNRPTPKGSSHIRQLDFSSPEKWNPSTSAESSTKNKKGLNSKNIRTTLFISATPDKTDESSKTLGAKANSETSKGIALEPSWDASLRGFQLSNSPIKTNQDKPIKRKRLDDPVTPVLGIKKMKENCNTTNDESAAGKSQIKKQENENPQLQKKTKVVDKKFKKKTDSEKKTKKKIIEVASDSGSPKINNSAEEVKTNINVEKPFKVINRNMNAKLRKKCNMDNSRRIISSDEVILSLSNVPKIKSLEVFDENRSTLILSPSKLNANKRTLVDVEHRSVVEQCLVKTSIDVKTSPTSGNKKDTISEELLDPPAKINSLPLLQTPIKADLLPVPKTPCINTSVTIDTPFTRAVIDQLSGVDLNSIPTPKFPITPNFSLTPAFTNSPFSNRGTDYSTSSSYYQPSDTEQNKSLEQLIQECRRLEKQDIFSNSDELDKKSSAETVKVDETEHSTTSFDTVLNVASNTADTKANEKSDTVLNKSEECIHKMLAEKQKAFNQSLPGMKNMQLVRMLSDADDYYSDSISSKDDSSSSDDDSSSSDSSCPSTPIKDGKHNPYSLRPRKTPSSGNKDDQISTKHRLSKSPEPIIKNEKAALISHKADVLQKMETIRQRTIAKFKNSPPAPKQKPNASTRSLTKLRKETAKVVNEKLIIAKKTTKKEPTKLENKSKPTNSRKIDGSPSSVAKSKNSPKKSNTKCSEDLSIKEDSKTSHATTTSVGNKSTKEILENKPTAIKESVTMAVEDEDIVLHLSSDDENLEPFEMVETELLECSASSTPLSCNKEDVNNENNNDEAEKILDKEAETLVKGLKQWGIHLIPNKSAKRVTSGIKEVKETKPEENKKPMDNKKEADIIEKKNLKEEGLKESKELTEENKKMEAVEEKKCVVDEIKETKTAPQAPKKSKNDKKDLPKQSKTTVNKNHPEFKKKPNQSLTSKNVKATSEIKDLQIQTVSEIKDKKIKETSGNNGAQIKITSELKDKPIKATSEDEHTEIKVTTEIKDKPISENKEQQIKITSDSKDNQIKPISENKQIKITTEVKEKHINATSADKDKQIKEATEIKDKHIKTICESDDQQIKITDDVKDKQVKEISENKDKPIKTTSEIKDKKIKEVSVFKIISDIKVKPIKNLSENADKQIKTSESKDKQIKPINENKQIKITSKLKEKHIKATIEDKEALAIKDKHIKPISETKAQKIKITGEIKDKQDKEISENKDKEIKITSEVKDKQIKPISECKDKEISENMEKPIKIASEINEKHIKETSEDVDKHSKITSESKDKPRDKQTKASSENKDKQMKVRNNKQIKTNENNDKKSEIKDKKIKGTSEIKDKQITKTNERKSSTEETELKRRLSIDKEKESNFEVPFDVKTFEGETIQIKHDYNATPTRKLSDYNLNILTKTFSANVFIKEINADVEKFLSCSRFKILLDVPPKSTYKKVENVKSSNENSSISQTRKKRPLDILYNQLINEPEEVRVPSPLDNLYGSDIISRERPASRKLISTLSSRAEKISKYRRSLSFDNSETSKNEHSTPEHHSSSEKQSSEQVTPKSDSLETNNEVESAQENVADSDNSDLMNYALCGSDRTENEEETPFTSPEKRKRKPSDDVPVEKKEEKKKKTEECQELLRNIDVDSFLKQLHGDM